MSKKIVNTLIEEGKIQIVDDKRYSFICVKCNTLTYGSLPKLVHKSKKYNGLCGDCKRKNTCLERYGVERPLQSDTIRKKAEQTCLERFGETKPFYSLNVLEKAKDTKERVYGYRNPFDSKEVQDSIHKNNLEKYGVEHVLQSKKIKEKQEQTCLDRYGTKYPCQLDTVKEKSKQTNLDKYGVEYFAQSTEAAKYHKTKYFYNELNFDSSWELAYYIYCVDHNVPVILHPTTIPYSFENHKCYYQPDFLINNSELVEIKGSHFLSVNNELINPFEKSKVSRQKSIAKQKCMNDNNVRIISLNEISPMLEYIKDTYGKNYLASFKIQK